MSLDDKAKLLVLLYQLHHELKNEAEAYDTDIDEDIDKALRTLIRFAD